MREITPLLEAAVQLHELFGAYVRAGFTEDQALRLLGYMLAASQRSEDG